MVPIYKEGTSIPGPLSVFHVSQGLSPFHCFIIYKHATEREQTRCR